MRVVNNVMALNTWRNLNLTNTSLSKAIERLSSGLRINRAADDAAGLAISEKMRGQIAGLNMAAKNAQDGISLIQTAEGALNEVHAMLQRMEELAVQAANDTNTPEDRAKLQAEMDQLAVEVARIGSTTEFNTLRLLDGRFANQDIVFHIGANENQNLRIRIGDMRSKALGLAADAGIASKTASVTVTVTDGDSDPDNDPAIPTGTGDVSYNASSNEWTVTIGGMEFTSTDGKTFTYTTADGDKVSFTLDEALPETDGSSIEINGTTATATSSHTAGTNNGLEAGVYTVVSGGLEDQNGNLVAKWDDTKSAYVDVNDSSKVLFTPDSGGELAAGSTLSIGGIDISSSQSAANSALPKIRAALEKVSDQRSLLGATQNRLEHTIANLQVAAENLTAAESRIRDADMAREMMNFVRQQILLQSGTAMLAQANAVPQSVLQLLA